MSVRGIERLVCVGSLVVSVAWGAADEAPNTARLSRDRAAGHLGKVIDVSVMNARFVALDETGRLVRDLRQEELRIFEDGASVRLLELEHRRASDEMARGGFPTTGAENERAQAFEQRVVV